MLPQELSDPGPLITYRHLGFENFQLEVLLVMAGRMAVAALLAALVAYRPWRRLMRWHFEPPESGAQVLIAVAGGLMTSVIGNNVALAFALVGLGGFIRFRSGIKDPREAGVMFFMIGIGMACGIGSMPLALTATAFGLVLLPALDIADRLRRRMARRRIRFGDVKDPRTLEPAVRLALERTTAVRGSRIALKNDEVVVDVFGDAIASAGQVVDLLVAAGIKFDGDISVEEI
ncbi:MAG TPA: DUF4956 domain-containing protein [Kofleriaceae bacterium]|nr:DUF4956 domain-containing protein [Kofleriaceae bacterium]